MYRLGFWLPLGGWRFCHCCVILLPLGLFLIVVLFLGDSLVKVVLDMVFDTLFLTS